MSLETQQTSTAPSRFTRFLDWIERNGNRLPHPATLFIWLLFIVTVGSVISTWFGVSAVHPTNGDTIAARSLISAQGLQYILANTVTNFTGFAPVGLVLVAMLGFGVAERAGLTSALLRALLAGARPFTVSFVLMMAGILSSIAADAGYVVLIPMGAMIFASMGRPPLAGIAVTFAGIAAGFGANLVIGPLDVVLAALSSEAAQIITTGRVVSPAGNYYFVALSTIVLALVGTWITERLVIPRLENTLEDKAEWQNVEVMPDGNEADRRGLIYCGWFTLGVIGVIIVGMLPGGVLRGSGSLTQSPLFQGLVPIISLYACLAALIFGKTTGSLSQPNSAINAMIDTMSTMATYLVVMFFAAQAINYFTWSHLGTILAIGAADVLQGFREWPLILMFALILLTALVNLLLGSASAKWAMLSPIIVPLFLLLGISPEAAQAAYRIGDSVTNIITPLMPYFPLVVVFAQRYHPKASIGTLIATMLPYSLAFLLAWSVLLTLWVVLGLPFGPGAYLAEPQ